MYSIMVRTTHSYMYVYKIKMDLNRDKIGTIYIHVYVKRKVWIRTIRGFCCANPGSTLCSANSRITF